MNTAHGLIRSVEPETAQLVAAILNSAWMVRHYSRLPSLAPRKQAILKLGLTVREAFNQSSDYEALLVALVDGLTPKDSPPRF